MAKQHKWTDIDGERAITLYYEALRIWGQINLANKAANARTGANNPPMPFISLVMKLRDFIPLDPNNPDYETYREKKGRVANKKTEEMWNKFHEPEEGE